MRVHKLHNIAQIISAQKLKKNSAVAFVFCEDETLITETVKYYHKRDFDRIFLFITEPEQFRAGNRIVNIHIKYEAPSDIWEAINLALPALRGHWLYWGLNGEFFYYPFCESRSVHDLKDFIAGERRYSIAGNVIDLYTGDIKTHTDGISMSNTYFDKSNYYSSPAYFENMEMDEDELSRIKFIYGGLRWRFAQHIPEKYRRIDRVPFFYVSDDLSFDRDGITKRPEFYTYRCEYHHNVTCAVMSFHIARYFRHNHHLRPHAEDFMWSGAQRFRWNSAQLLRLGLIETGQWF